VVTQRKVHLIGRHSGAVIGHANGTKTTPADVDTYLASSRVKRIVDQLAHHGNRPFDYLSRRDSFHYVGWKYLDSGTRSG
jgi:hypothetical protein